MQWGCVVGKWWRVLAWLFLWCAGAQLALAAQPLSHVEDWVPYVFGMAQMGGVGYHVGRKLRPRWLAWRARRALIAEAEDLTWSAAQDWRAR